MKATVTIDKSFKDSKEFSKTWENGDFEKFFKVEGEYLDRLAKMTEAHGKEGEGFTLVYTVTLKK